MKTWTYRVVSRPIDVAPLYHLEGELTREGYFPDHGEEACNVCNGSGEGEYDIPGELFPCDACGGSGRRDWTGCDVRVRYRYLASERAVLDEQVIRARFASALRLKVEGIAVPDRELRAPAVVTARTLTEKLAAMRPEGELPPSLANKVAALEQRDADAILTDVRAWLAALEQGEKAQVAA